MPPARRKNAKRLRELRRRGVPIDSDYRVPTEWAIKRWPDGIDGVELVAADDDADIVRVDPRVQKELLNA
jgi:hypothetical protein